MKSKNAAATPRFLLLMMIAASVTEPMTTPPIPSS
ncbi:hypothetical protein GGD63_006968 [Bradyrhizobium sp. cir1]|nr:hypothetical protein [Bradyrhizobium sp. cir1]